MLGLVLEGGGAKGAFHAGVLKALYENGYHFDGVMGTSIGALNGAMVAQGDFESCYELWYNIVPSQVLDVDDNQINKIISRKYDRDSLLYLLKLLKNTISSGGFATDKIISFLRKYIDEDKLRASPIDFGIVTVSITDNFTPLEIFKEEIPYGYIHDFVMASANYPALKLNTIDGKRYIDGGIYDNMPINPLIRRGYDDIIVIRTMSDMPHQKVIDDTVHIRYINPSDNLGGTLGFTNESVRNNLELGYYDGLRFVFEYTGVKYYLRPLSEEVFLDKILAFDDEIFKNWAIGCNFDASLDKSSIFEIVIKNIKTRLKLPMETNNYLTFILMLENFARQFGVERFKIYDFDEFLAEIIKNYKPRESSFFDNLKKKIFDYGLENIFIALVESSIERSRNGAENQNNT